MAKFSFYLDTRGIEGAKFDEIENGNPGCGGTQYATISLAHELAKTGHSVNLFVTSAISIKSEVKLRKVSSFEEAALNSAQDQAILIFTAPRELDLDIQIGLSLENLKAIAWMHIDPLPQTVKSLSEFASIRVFVSLGKRQFVRFLLTSISPKLAMVQNGQYLSSMELQNEGSKQVSYIGALVPQKGFHILAEAWPRVLEVHPDAVLNVVGSGNLHNYISNPLIGGVAESSYFSVIVDLLGQSISSVNFLGRISAAEKDQIVCKSRVGVVNPTGNTENCPASALDFQALGVPVIAGKKRGNMDVIRHQETGWLVPTSSDGLATKLIEVLNFEVYQAKDFELRCKSYVSSNFSFAKITNEWVALENFAQGKSSFLSRSIPYPVSLAEFGRIVLYQLRSIYSHFQRKTLK